MRWFWDSMIGYWLLLLAHFLGDCSGDLRDMAQGINMKE